MHSTRPKYTGFVFLVVLTPTLLGQTPPDRCNDILRNGVFNTHVINSTSTNVDNFRKWECSVTLKTHADAINAGLSLGVEVYGVPLTLGGSWSQGQQDAWKQTNCSSSERQQSSSITYYEFIKTADPAILAAWSRCMDNNAGSSSAVSCRIEKAGDKLLFQSRCKRTAGETPSQAPQVTYYKAFDATCDRAWSTTPTDPMHVLAESDTLSLVLRLTSQRQPSFLRRRVAIAQYPMRS